MEWPAVGQAHCLPCEGAQGGRRRRIFRQFEIVMPSDDLCGDTNPLVSGVRRYLQGRVNSPVEEYLLRPIPVEFVLMFRKSRVTELLQRSLLPLVREYQLRVCP